MVSATPFQLQRPEESSQGQLGGLRQSAAIVSDVPQAEQVAPLCRLLMSEGFHVELMSKEQVLLGPSAGTPYDLAVLDLIRFDSQGERACRLLREPNEYIPIVVLSEENTVADRIRGFDCGIDDFIGKPYSAREVSARVRSLLRRSNATTPQHVLRYDDLSVDLASRVAYRGEHYIDLSRREFALLVYLLRNPDRAISRTEFLKNVWANSTSQERSNVVDVYINYVRNKTEQGGLHRLIHTVRGQGYMLHDQRKL